ncbi:hypothetical protein N9U60_03070 [Betaproteobacteria bacterium]|nr:hypothetical protein [Betaproteobacteria bacterium]
MSGLGKKQSTKLYVGEELTKTTIVQELSNAIAFLKTHGSSKQLSIVSIDFIKLKRVDTLAVVFIVQIERFISRSSEDFKISYQNLPNDLTSLLKLTSMEQAIFND